MTPYRELSVIDNYTISDQKSKAEPKDSFEELTREFKTTKDAAEATWEFFVLKEITKISIERSAARLNLFFISAVLFTINNCHMFFVGLTSIHILLNIMIPLIAMVILTLHKKADKDLFKQVVLTQALERARKNHTNLLKVKVKE